MKAHNNLGVAFLESGAWDTAIQEFRAALATRPTNLESLVNLGLALEAQGRRAEAIEALRDALAVDPRSAEAHYNLALVHERQGDVRLALEHYGSFLDHGGRSHPDLAADVRQRLERLASDQPSG